MRVFTVHRGQTLHIGSTRIKAEVVDRGKVRLYVDEAHTKLRTRVTRDDDRLETVVASWSTPPPPPPPEAPPEAPPQAGPATASSNVEPSGGSSDA